MARGIERRAIIQDDRDRADFVSRLAALAQAGGITRAEVLSGSRCRALGLPIAGAARALRLSPTLVRAGLARADGLAATRGLTVADLLRARARNPR